MTRNPGRAIQRALMGTVAAAGFGLAAVSGVATAAADPAPDLPVPVPGEAEAVPPPVPDPLYAAAGETRERPLTAFADVLGSTSPVMVLGESLAPGASGVDPLNAAQLLFPQNYRMPTPDMESPYLLTQGAPPGPFARVDGMKGVHALLQGALGRMPADQLGDPLPGTAPPPGTNIPAGPEQFLPDPAVALPPPASAPAG